MTRRRTDRTTITRATMAMLALILLFLAFLNSESTARASTGGGGTWPWPLVGEVLTSYTNGDDPYAAGQHRGIDIAAGVGTTVAATVNGRVTFSGRLPDGGQSVTVASADGQWLISNLHLSRRAVVRGQDVAAGDEIGSVGTSGRRSTTRSHLHLGVRRADTRAYVDPMALLGTPRVAAPRTATPPRVVANKRPRALSDTARPRALSDTARPRALSNTVHAQEPGDARPARRHGDAAAVAAAAGARAREGRVASGNSRTAPPPLRTGTLSTKPRRRPAEVPVDAPAQAPATPEVAASTAASTDADRSSSPRRALLLAIAAVCLLALLLRRRPQQRDLPEPTPEAEPAEVIELRRAS